MKLKLRAVTFLLFVAVSLSAQAAPPPGFDAFRLGMSLTELKAALKSNTYFLYSGEPDVTMLTRPNTNLIDVPGIYYFSRGIFQVVDGRLYSIALELNPVEVSYFSVYTTLTKKYGEPTGLDPSSAHWDSASVRMSLEKPLTVKYLDMAVFLKLQKDGQAKKALEAITREKFLENF